MRSSLGPSILITLLVIGSQAGAQTPPLSEVPAAIAEPARAQLIRQRAGLVDQQGSIAAKVRAHNERCADVAEGSALEATCAASQNQLNALIADYRAAAESFNLAVTSARRAPP